MKIIITGALGHIGSKLVRFLSRNLSNVQVVMIDNLLTQRYCSLFNLPENGKFRFIQADILSYNLKDLLEKNDVVIHLAAITDMASSFENINEVENINLNGTKIVAEACALKSAKLIFVSTTSVYTPTSATVDENCGANDLLPATPYAQSKLNAEKFLNELEKSSGLKYITCRFGTIFGASIGMRFHTAVNKFCWQAVMKNPLSVWSTAYYQRRPYLDLEDAVRAIDFIISKDLFTGDIYNIVTENCAVKDIVDCIKNEIPDLAIELVDAKAMNDFSFDVLTEKFTSLGFDFKGNLQQSITETIHLLKKANT